ncbi:unnamed protein product [Haemonchus placei]|uniref:Uncharacterized protein n=1 Tax=Haemonchus placei TaxID=6290 RepID=A0A3P7XG38_HAEPC|nr:unnamed protein product [Haemonchus placei]
MNVVGLCIFHQFRRYRTLFRYMRGNEYYIMWRCHSSPHSLQKKPGRNEPILRNRMISFH